MPQPRSEAGMGFWASQWPQAYLKKSTPGETDVSMFHTSGSCSGESVGPPARAGAAAPTRTIATMSAPSGRANSDPAFIRVPFVDVWGNAAHIRAARCGREARGWGTRGAGNAKRAGRRSPARSHACSRLVDQHDAQRPLLAAGLEPRAIDAGCHLVTGPIGAVPGNGVIARLQHAVGEPRHTAAGDVVERELHALRLREPEA